VVVRLLRWLLRGWLPSPRFLGRFLGRWLPSPLMVQFPVTTRLLARVLLNLIEFGKELIAGSRLHRSCHSRWRRVGRDNRDKERGTKVESCHGDVTMKYRRSRNYEPCIIHAPPPRFNFR
jgi:hypothetical protein